MSWQIAWLHSLFGNAPAVASGVAAALRQGGGGTVDIGMGCLSCGSRRSRTAT